MGKKSNKWLDLAHEGRYIRRAFNIAVHAMERIERDIKKDESYEPDLETLEKISAVMVKCVKMNTDIIKHADHEQRLKNIELIIDHIPPAMITEIKEKMQK